MGIKKYFNNRYNIIYVLIVILMSVLGFRMAVLTIVQGEGYREIADRKSVV